MRRSQDLDIEVLEEGELGLREANSSRRLAKEEMEESLYVLECKDRFCKDQLAKLDEGDVVDVIPGDPIPTLPAQNSETRATATPVVEAPVLLTKIPVDPVQTFATVLRN